MRAAIVSGSDTSPVLDAAEEVLDLVTLPLEGPMVFDQGLAVWTRRDAEHDAAFYKAARNQLLS